MSPQTPRQFASGTPGEEPPTNQLPAMTGEVLAAAQARAEAKLAESNAETGMSAYPPIEFARPAATPPSPPGGQPAKRPPKKHHPLRVVVIVALVLALSGVGTLFGTSKYFAGKAKIGTSIAGTAVTGKTEAQMLDMVNQTGGNTTLTLDLNGKQAPYDLQALGITVDAQQTVDNALGKNDPANKSWWPVRRVDVPIVFNYSENQLQQALDADFVDGSLTPKNAAVSYDGTSSKFTVTSDQPGATVDVSPVLAAIDTLSKGGTVGVISLTTQTVPAPITSDAATQAANSANSTIGQEYTFATPKKSVTLDSKQVASWLTLTPDALAGTIAVGVDQDAVSQQLPEFLNTQIAKPAVNKKVLVAPDGTQIVVETPGQDGTTIADPTAAVTALTQALTAGKGLKYDLATTTQPYKTDTVTVGGAYDQPHGSKWIDVNQTTFKVSLYEGTTLVHTMPCVTGAVGHDTPLGTFYVYLKYASQTMKGPGYVQPNVPWVMYFKGGAALHGAYWRSTWGYRASHGCVNLPVSEAKYAFDWAPLGTKVVVHF